MPNALESLSCASGGKGERGAATGVAHLPHLDGCFGVDIYSHILHLSSERSPQDFRKASNLVASITPSRGAVRAEKVTAKNVQRGLAQKIQEASAQFRVKQRVYMQSKLKDVDGRTTRVGLGLTGRTSGTFDQEQGPAGRQRRDHPARDRFLRCAG